MEQHFFAISLEHLPGIYKYQTTLGRKGFIQIRGTKSAMALNFLPKEGPEMDVMPGSDLTENEFLVSILVLPPERVSLFCLMMGSPDVVYESQNEQEFRHAHGL